MRNTIARLAEPFGRLTLGRQGALCKTKFEVMIAIDTP